MYLCCGRHSSRLPEELTYPVSVLAQVLGSKTFRCCDKMLVRRSLVGFSDGLGFWFTCISNAAAAASLAQLVEHALRKRMVTGSIPVGGLCSSQAAPRSTAFCHPKETKKSGVTHIHATRGHCHPFKLTLSHLLAVLSFACSVASLSLPSSISACQVGTDYSMPTLQSAS